MKQHKHILALLLLLAYTGQAVVAAGAPCFMMSAAGEHDMMTMDHSGHDMTMPDQNTTGGDCCEGGFCSMSHCQMALAMPVSVAPAAAEKAITYGAATAVPAIIPSLDSLYRPPISA
jgi:hypothetical protein